MKTQKLVLIILVVALVILLIHFLMTRREGWYEENEDILISYLRSPIRNKKGKTGLSCNKGKWKHTKYLVPLKKDDRDIKNNDVVIEDVVIIDNNRKFLENNYPNRAGYFTGGLSHRSTDYLFNSKKSCKNYRSGNWNAEDVNPKLLMRLSQLLAPHV